MKLNAALAKSLLLAASVGLVVPILAQTTTTPAPSTPTTPPSKTPPAKATPVTPPPAKTTKPAKPTKPSKPTPAPAPEPETPADAPLPGVVQARPSGGFLTVEIVEGKFKMSFYDAKKKPVPADVARAAAHWRSNKKVSEEHTVLNPSGDGKSLIGASYVRPPVFKVFFTLLNEEGTGVETYALDMNTSGAAAGGAAADTADSKM